MKRAPAPTRQLEPLGLGREAWWIVQTPPTPSGRRMYQGAARVVVDRVESVMVDDLADVVYRVTVLAVASGTGLTTGHRTTARRGDLYGKGEARLFASIIRKFHTFSPVD